MSGELIAGRYELEQLVGTGGMSSVYRAHDRQLERTVAVKVLHAHFGDDEEHVARFRHEARAVAQLSHPHIVTVIDRGVDDGRQFIVFEYVDGENLKQLVGRSGPLPIRRAIEIALEIADGLAFAHARGIVHRDVKPQNVLLGPDGSAKVTDFGIARSLAVEGGVTVTGTVLGTSSYLSPEQASGLPVQPTTDVYSLGVVLYELLAGDVPFRGDNAVAVALRQVNEPPPDPRTRRPDVPARLAAAVDRALAKDPADRFPSMDAFARELRDVRSGPGDPDAEQTAVVRRPAAVRHTRRRRRAVVVALVVAAAVAAAAAVIAVTLDSSKQEAPANAAGGAAPTALRGLAAYDPDGDGHEHDADAPKAADGDLATYWTTEHYRSFDKSGVGVVLDAGRSVRLARLTVASDTPGFTAEIRSGDSVTGPFATDAAAREVGTQTTFTLDGRSARYYVVWITSLGAWNAVHVNEVRARS